MSEPAPLAAATATPCLGLLTVARSNPVSRSLLPCFSPHLRGEVLSHVSSRTLQAVPYFRGCERELLNALAARLTHHGFARCEMMRGDGEGLTLSIVTRGTAVRGGKPITLYQYW